jgi:hypothetical protein
MRPRAGSRTMRSAVRRAGARDQFGPTASNDGVAINGVRPCALFVTRAVRRVWFASYGDGGGQSRGEGRGAMAMAEDHWHPARLIPTSGINGQDEAERRATSALLAVISAVREFGACIVRPLGAPTGALSTFIEVPSSSATRWSSPTA